MLKKDYLLRQFEEFGKVLANLLALKKDGDWEKFEREISDATEKFTSLELDTIEKQSENELDVMLQKTTLAQDQKLILATLMFEKMNIYVEANDRDSYLNMKRKCYLVYKHLQDNFTENEFNLDVHYKLEFLSRIDD